LNPERIAGTLSSPAILSHRRPTVDRHATVGGRGGGGGRAGLVGVLAPRRRPGGAAAGHPYEQLDLARRITALAVAGQVTGLERELGRIREGAAEKEAENAELRERVALQETNARIRLARLCFPSRFSVLFG
jgi:hypothetical protein